MEFLKVMIVGHGYVGSAVASIFEDHEKVIIDPKFNDNKISDYSEDSFMAVFVCVDTPKGSNTTVLNQVLAELLFHSKLLLFYDRLVLALLFQDCSEHLHK